MTVEVLNLILSTIIVFLGIGLLYLAIYDNPKKLAAQMNADNSPRSEKYKKAQKILDVTVAFGYFAIGILLVSNFIPREYALICLVPLALIEKIFEYRLKKKYQVSI